MVEARKRGGALGAQIIGLDLTRPIEKAAFEAVEAAFQEHLVLIFRGTPMEPAQFVAFSRNFGKL